MLKFFGMQLNYNTTGWKEKLTVTWTLLFMLNFMFDLMMKTHYLVSNVANFKQFLDGIPMWTSAVNTAIRFISFNMSKRLVNDFLEDIVAITNKG
jgi:hypothetical protein